MRAQYHPSTDSGFVKLSLLRASGPAPVTEPLVSLFDETVSTQSFVPSACQQRLLQR